jgi:uncharacterized NAD(P)/FAD-binding protein YdhS
MYLLWGGGVSGVLADAHILRADPVSSVTLVDPCDRVGLGLAQSASDESYLQNVRAEDMSALTGDPPTSSTGFGQNDMTQARIGSSAAVSLANPVAASLRHG